MRVFIGGLQPGQLMRFYEEERVYPSFCLYGDPDRDIALYTVEEYEKLKAWLDRNGFSDDLGGE